MSKRKERPLPEEECIARDKAEIENLEKGGPIAMADYTIINEGTKKEFELQLEQVLKKIKN
jgi:dephospho-CoA kinase